MAYQFRNADAPAGGWRNARSTYDFDVDGGTQKAYVQFTVTGTVLVHVFGVCQTSFTGGSTISLGISGNTAAIIAATTDTDLDQYETWQDASPEANPGAVDLTGRSFVITNGTDIQLLIASANVTAGVADFYCLWSPLSADGNVVSA